MTSYPIESVWYRTSGNSLTGAKLIRNTLSLPLSRFLVSCLIFHVKSSRPKTLGFCCRRELGWLVRIFRCPSRSNPRPNVVSILHLGTQIFSFSRNDAGLLKILICFKQSKIPWNNTRLMSLWEKLHLWTLQKVRFSPNLDAMYYKVFYFAYFAYFTSTKCNHVMVLFVNPFYNYMICGCLALGTVTKSCLRRIFSLQQHALRLVTFANNGSTSTIFSKMSIANWDDEVTWMRWTCMHEIINALRK